MTPSDGQWSHHAGEGPDIRALNALWVNAYLALRTVVHRSPGIDINTADGLANFSSHGMDV